jgi:hypothetical protein
MSNGETAARLAASMKRSQPSPRVRVLVFMLMNLALMANLGLLAGPRLGWGMAGLYGLATAEGAIAVVATPGISRLGRASFLLIATLIIGGLVAWPRRGISQAVAFGPALIILAATLIVIGPGWQETFHR